MIDTAFFTEPLNIIALLSAVVLFAVNKDRSYLYNYLDRQSNKNQKRLTELREFISVHSKNGHELLNAAQEEHDAIVFTLISGITVGPKRRRALVSLQQQYQGNISWKDLRVAQDFILDGPNNELSIKDESWFQQLGYWVNLMMGLTLAFLSLLSLVFLFLTLITLKVEAIYFLSLAIGLFGFALFVLNENRPMKVARRLRTLLNEESERQSKSQILIDEG